MLVMTTNDFLMAIPLFVLLYFGVRGTFKLLFRAYFSEKEKHMQKLFQGGLEDGKTDDSEESSVKK